ncbi:hypothetical protein ACS0PU_010090 [Formica fusca]
MTTRRGLSLDVIDVVGHEVGMERTVLRTHGQPARWLSAGHDRYKSWAIVESLLVFGGSLMPLLSLSNIANAQRGTIVKRKREARERERKYVCVYVCGAARGLRTEKRG